MFFNINTDPNPKVIGVNNGVYQVELNKKQYDSNTFAQLSSMFISGEFTTEQKYPEITYSFYFKKLKLTKETDFMSFCPYLNHCLFLIRNNAIALLKPFNIQQYKIYKATISDYNSENQNISYGLFYSVLQDWNMIDFEKTVFTSGGIGNNPLVEHSFYDENEMKKFKGITHVKTLALSKNFDASLDFFLTRLGGMFVSERLKNALEENKVTGIVYKNNIQVILP